MSRGICSVCAFAALLVGCARTTSPSALVTGATQLAPPTPQHPNRPGEAAASSASTAAAAAGSSAVGSESSVSGGTESGRPDVTARAGSTDGRKFVALDTSVFFANLDVTRDPSLGPSELRLSVRVEDGPFGELTRRQLAGKVQDGRLLVRVPLEYPTVRDPVRKQQVGCSYVIDCDSDLVLGLGKEELAPNPTVSDLVQFTSRFIASKSLSRGFDVASEVARSREGDCSEHAVLLAALARRHRQPARVIFGFAVLRFGNRLPILVGHAWTEIHDGGKWQLGDAALAKSDLARVPDLLGLSYLPVQVLEREDLGFRAKLVSDPGAWQVEKAEGNF